MSVITDVLLIVSCIDDREVEDVNSHLFLAGQKWGLNRVDTDGAGGGKVFTENVFRVRAAAVNYADDFVEALKTAVVKAEWTFPEEVLLVVRHEQRPQEVYTLTRTGMVRMLAEAGGDV